MYYTAEKQGQVILGSNESIHILHYEFYPLYIREICGIMTKDKILRCGMTVRMIRTMRIVL